MERKFFHILVIGVLCGVGSVVPVQAQDASGTPTVRTAGTVANLFVTLDFDRSVGGVRLDLPEGWHLRDVRLLRFGTEAISVRQEPDPSGTMVLVAARPLEGPHELVLQVYAGGTPGTYTWSLTPFFRQDRGESSDSLGGRSYVENERLSREVILEPPSVPPGGNQVLDLRDAAQPLLLRDRVLPFLGRDRSFTVEFWMKTGGLDEVVLSTWTGEEAVAYPVEVVVDRSGRLRSYWGQAGRHQALRAATPVADDRWHHVAVVYDAETPRLRLLVDGVVADSSGTSVQAPKAGAFSMALGGRLPGRMADGAARPLYTGRIDELRIWPDARPVSSLQRMRSQPFTSGTDPESHEHPVRLSFDSDPAGEIAEWPDGAQRVSTTLSFRSSLRDLRARTDGNNVTLSWQTAAADTSQFIVERSTDGHSFRTIARLQPDEAGSSVQEPHQMTYTDQQVSEQVVYYRIRQAVVGSRLERTTGMIKIGLGTETDTEENVQLVGNFPNPFVETTTIAYRVNEAEPITVTIWDLAGHRIATLADEVHEPGYYEKTFDPEDLPSGTYFARLQTSEETYSHRMVLLK